MKPAVSIIVPVYKVETYLRECVDSVLVQSFSDFELLLVDDGSPDSCGDICDEYAAADPRVHALHKSNGGLSSARNYGMNHATGKWLIFLDSDDLWGDRDGLRKLVDYAERFALDILRFEYKAVNDSGERIYPRPFEEKDLPVGAFSNFDMVDKAIAGEWFAWLYLIRATSVHGLRFDETTLFQEDIDFYCKLFATKEMRCGYLAEKIYNYRKRESSLTASCNINNLKGSFALCDVFYWQSMHISDNRLRNLYRYNSVMMYYWTMCTLSENPYYSERKRIINLLDLEELQKKVECRMSEVKIAAKHVVFIASRPSVGVRLLRLKNWFVKLLYKSLYLR